MTITGGFCCRCCCCRRGYGINKDEERKVRRTFDAYNLRNSNVEGEAYSHFKFYVNFFQNGFNFFFQIIN